MDDLRTKVYVEVLEETVTTLTKEKARLQTEIIMLKKSYEELNGAHGRLIEQLEEKGH
tara:strand:+ start:1783 stop:1956 length:174 start_codon:yes stop_codon:yes gene_type:complete